MASPTGGAAINAAVAQGPSFKKVERNEPILLDVVFAWKGYISDHTRIFTIGKLPKKLVDAHDCMLELQDRIKEIAKPGAVAGELYQAAVEITEKQGVEKILWESERIGFDSSDTGLDWNWTNSHSSQTVRK